MKPTLELLVHDNRNYRIPKANSTRVGWLDWFSGIFASALSRFQMAYRERPFARQRLD
jgi:hypothetical protein